MPRRENEPPMSTEAAQTDLFLFAVAPLIEELIKPAKMSILLRDRKIVQSSTFLEGTLLIHKTIDFKKGTVFNVLLLDHIDEMLERQHSRDRVGYRAYQWRKRQRKVNFSRGFVKTDELEQLQFLESSPQPFTDEVDTIELFASAKAAFIERDARR